MTYETAHHALGYFCWSLAYTGFWTTQLAIFISTCIAQGMDTMDEHEKRRENEQPMHTSQILKALQW